MPQEKPISSLLDWEKIVWEPAPYQGVFIHKVEEQLDPLNPNIPLFTVIALKLAPKAIIPLHRHNREAGWTETINLPHGGHIEIEDSHGTNEITVKHAFTMVIKAEEIFGLKNMDPFQPLYFYSTMKPGFTGFAEIEEVK